MASSHVWGLDIGQCSLKALRGRLSDDGTSVSIESFDFIEYPQILSQPDANPAELVREALKTFLARNQLRGDKVAVALSGQSGLARFIKLPPVDAKQLPNLVGFEAKQQIPFALEDVVWDYQRMPGSSAKPAGGDDEDDDLPLETEVGLFAIKRDQVLRSIRPLVDAEVELDFIQLAPICIYNAIGFDQLKADLPAAAEGPRPWVVILALGTDNSDLVVTNGFRIWQRSIPIGGNHFTKQLTKELKLTFAKAEHVKRHARQAEDAKQIFQAMRSVFNDLVTEVQRSVGYFNSLERSAEIKQLLLLGNAAKLPGLPQYLEKNLGLPTAKLSSYERLTGPIASEDGTFQEQLLAFPVCYGLLLQGLGKAQMKTNLVPPEIVRARLIRRKKPWAAAIAASLLLACAFNYLFNFRAWNQVNPSTQVKNVTWEAATKRVNDIKSTVGNYESADSDLQQRLERLNELGEAIVGMDDGRKLWLELLKTVTDCLPVDEGLEDPMKLTSIKDRPLDQRPEIYIDVVESQYFTDLSEWNTPAVQQLYSQFQDERRAAAAPLGTAVDAAAPTADGTPPADGSSETPPAEGDGMAVEPADTADPLAAESSDAPGVEGSGWVIEIRGHHFQRKGRLKDRQYVRMTLMEQLESGRVKLPGPDGEEIEFSVKELGILSPILVEGKIDYSRKIPNPDYEPPKQDDFMAGERGPAPFRPGPFGAAPRPGDSAQPKEDPNNPQYFSADSFNFTIQFCWKQIPLKKRLKIRRENEQAATLAQAGGEL